MLPVFGRYAVAGVADPGDGGAGEIEGLAVEILDDFDDVGIHYLAGEGDSGTGCGKLDGIVVGHGGGDGVDGAGVYERLVALHVDIDVGGDVGGDFGDAVGSGAVVWSGQNGLGPEGFDGGFDAGICGGDDDARREGG